MGEKKIKAGLIFSDIKGSSSGRYSPEEIKKFLLASLNVIDEIFEEGNRKDIESFNYNFTSPKYAISYEGFIPSKGVSKELLLESFFSKNFNEQSRTYFKMVGDGIIHIIKYPSKDFKILAQEYHNKLKEKINIDFRTIVTVGTIYCFPLSINGCNLIECLGPSLNQLIKFSKKVEDFKFFELLK